MERSSLRKRAFGFVAASVAGAWIQALATGGIAALVATGQELLKESQGLPLWVWLTAAFLVLSIWARPYYYRLWYRYKLVEWTGITRVIPKNADLPPKTTAGNALVDVVRDSKTLRMLLVSGYDFVGNVKHRGILYDALYAKQQPLRLEILLLDPSQANKRAALASIPLDRYQEGMNAVLWTLAGLKKARGLDVHVWRYMDEPIWQMIMNDQELWLLCAHNQSTTATAVYCLKRDAELGLAQGMAAAWDRRRNAGDTRAVDLHNLVEPRWESLVGPEPRTRSDPPPKKPRR